MARRSWFREPGYLLCAHAAVAFIWAFLILSGQAFEHPWGLKRGLAAATAIYAVFSIFAVSADVWTRAEATATVAVTTILLTFDFHTWVGSDGRVGLALSIAGGTVLVMVEGWRRLEWRQMTVDDLKERFFALSLASCALISVIWMVLQVLLEPIYVSASSLGLLSPAFIFAGTIYLFSVEVPAVWVFGKRASGLRAVLRQVELILQSWSLSRVDELNTVIESEKWALESLGVGEPLREYLRRCQMLGFTDEARRIGLIGLLKTMENDEQLMPLRPLPLLSLVYDAVTRLLP